MYSERRTMQGAKLCGMAQVGRQTGKTLSFLSLSFSVSLSLKARQSQTWHQLAAPTSHHRA
eukprot:365942-Chlamydomonas_euryale.AAC.42